MQSILINLLGLKYSGCLVIKKNFNYYKLLGFGLNYLQRLIKEMAINNKASNN